MSQDSELTQQRQEGRRLSHKDLFFNLSGPGASPVLGYRGLDQLHKVELGKENTRGRNRECHTSVK
jgi:hypothetical protein